ncbi:MFS transporter [Allobaculum mucilyticum]|uniref:MFS transporter n=1 Tax=Allobaculum mucilyticum TaxID=2834459 RepID=UPI001E5E01D7|nr:MFS transporter [Allobaculum mucilyticum]UNT96070.1 MFS transporter [Allobaculum mucilyticum]
MKNKLTSLELKWILYDAGNSAFILLAGSILPIYFNYLATSGGLSETEYLSWWSYGASIATVLVALIGPVLGTLADFPHRKKKIFLGTALIGALLLFFFWMPTSWMAFLILFIACKVLYSISLVIYDSMLVDVAPSDRLDEVSSQGYAWGYIGSCVPFIISLGLMLGYENLDMSFQTAIMLVFMLNAGWWAFLTLPLAFSYKQIHSTPVHGAVFSHTFRRLFGLIKNIRHQKKVLLFMLGFFFYIDGVYTIIDMATAYGTSLGLDQTGLLLALLLTQVIAFPAAIFFGNLAKSHSAEKLIKIGIIAYFGISVFALFMYTIWQFWVLACAVGLFQGAIQALSRSYYTRIIPKDQAGEYFGLYDIAGKGASFLGTLIVGIVTQVTGEQNIAVGTLAFLFLLGYIVFSKAAKLPDPVYSETH